VTAKGWRAAALCAQVGTDLFFPEQGGSLKQPKKVCKRCPVRAECLADALEQGDQWGMRGGLSEIERRKLHAAHAR
jgi:WhiB family redox-sensing transcriptional regulator